MEQAITLEFCYVNEWNYLLNDIKDKKLIKTIQ